MLLISCSQKKHSLRHEIPVIIVIMISCLSCQFVVLLDWPQSVLAASLCAVLIVSHSVSSTFPQSSTFVIPSLVFLLSFLYSIFFFKSISLGVLDYLYLARHCQTSVPPLIPASFPFHSSLNSVNSSDSRGSSGSHSHSPSSSSSSSPSHHLFHHHHPRHRFRSSTLPQQTPARLSSISSHDSGFISSSQDQYSSYKSSLPMPAETKVRKNSLHTIMSLYLLHFFFIYYKDLRTNSVFVTRTVNAN